MADQRLWAKRPLKVRKRCAAGLDHLPISAPATAGRDAATPIVVAIGCGERYTPRYSWSQAGRLSNRPSGVYSLSARRTERYDR